MAQSLEDEVNEAGQHKEVLEAASNELDNRAGQVNHKTSFSTTEVAEAAEVDDSAGETTINHNETETRLSRYGPAGS